MKFPARFQILPAYFFRSVIKNGSHGPSIREIVRFLAQPGKEQRASKFIERVEKHDEYLAVYFVNNPTCLYYPSRFRWVDFCQTVDECFNPENWHNFLSPDWQLKADDVVVDCGAAEGLFSLASYPLVKRVYAIEPEQRFVRALGKTFEAIDNVTVLPYAVGHRASTASLSSNEIFSRITGTGDISIEVRTLDELLGASGEKISFIKADVEGYEFRTILGAENIIREFQPRIAVTVYHPQNNVSEITDFLRECHTGYQIRTKGIFDNGHPVLMQAWCP